MASLASTLITRAMDNSGRSSLGTARSGATLENKNIHWLNDVMRRMSRRHDFREMRKQYSAATIASQKTYSFPTNYKTLRDFRLIDGFNSIKLIMLIPERFDKRVPYPENHSTGRPHWYIPYGKNFDLFKIPDAAYTIYMKTTQWPLSITTIGDTIDYDEDKDDIIVAGMTSENFNYMQMYEDGIAWNNTFEDRLRRAILRDEESPDWGPMGRGFDSQRDDMYWTEYWNDPMIRGNA